MTPDQIALARRAVQCRGWRWTEGMLAWAGPVPTTVRLGREEAVAWTAAGTAGPEWLPVLDDPATTGCLTKLAREAWRDPGLCCVFDPDTTAEDPWSVWPSSDYTSAIASGPTEAAALVATLEGAP